jgi:hypothetical protein
VSIRLSLFAINVTLPALARQAPVAYAYLLHALDAGVDLEQPLVPSNLDELEKACTAYAERCEIAGDGVRGQAHIVELQSRVLSASGYDTGSDDDGFESTVQALVEQDGENPPEPSQS